MDIEIKIWKNYVFMYELTSKAQRMDLCNIPFMWKDGFNEFYEQQQSSLAGVEPDLRTVVSSRILWSMVLNTFWSRQVGDSVNLRLKPNGSGVVSVPIKELNYKLTSDCRSKLNKDGLHIWKQLLRSETPQQLVLKNERKSAQ